MVTLDEISAYVDQLIGEEAYDEIDGIWCFRTGGQCSRCTDSARKVAQRFGGEVFGFFSYDNPEALVSQYAVEGHDFALIRGRWVVDYWAFRVQRLMDKPVFDLCDRGDRSRVADLLGPSTRWDNVIIVNERAT